MIGRRPSAGGCGRAALVAAYLLTAAIACLASTPARAVTPDEMLADPVLEARARTISKDLRCLVCQNESIDESNADLAHDLRVLVRQRLTAGDSDEQAIQYIVSRYGKFVLLKPPVEPATYLLWFGPVIVVLLGAAGAVIHLRRRRPAAAGEPEPLSEDERRRIERILRRNDPT